MREFAVVYLIGAIGYSLIEILWRGYTHWTMSVTGGAAFVLLYLIDQHMQEKALILRAIAGTIIITSVELIAGCIINLAFHLDVWDYSNHAGNILGQICPMYCVLWFFLCISVMPLGRWIRLIIR